MWRGKNTCKLSYFFYWGFIVIRTRFGSFSDFNLAGVIHFTRDSKTKLLRNKCFFCLDNELLCNIISVLMSLEHYIRRNSVFLRLLLWIWKTELLWDLPTLLCDASRSLFSHWQFHSKGPRCIWKATNIHESATQQIIWESWITGMIIYQEIF